MDKLTKLREGQLTQKAVINNKLIIAEDYNRLVDKLNELVDYVNRTSNSAGYGVPYLSWIGRISQISENAPTIENTIYSDFDITFDRIGEGLYTGRVPTGTASTYYIVPILPDIQGTPNEGDIEKRIMATWAGDDAFSIYTKGSNSSVFNSGDDGVLFHTLLEIRLYPI